MRRLPTCKHAGGQSYKYAQVELQTTDFDITYYKYAFRKRMIRAQCITFIIG
jgi:hypothetical protein